MSTKYIPPSCPPIHVGQKQTQWDRYAESFLINIFSDDPAKDAAEFADEMMALREKSLKAQLEKKYLIKPAVPLEKWEKEVLPRSNALDVQYPWKKMMEEFERRGKMDPLAQIMAKNMVAKDSSLTPEEKAKMSSKEIKQGPPCQGMADEHYGTEREFLKNGMVSVQSLPSPVDDDTLHLPEGDRGHPCLCSCSPPTCESLVTKVEITFPGWDGEADEPVMVELPAELR